MKKLFAFLMVVIMLFALTACGGAEKTPETTAPAVTTPETTAVPTTEAPTEAPTTAPTESAIVFDTGWAGDEYEMPIPQPPFTQFAVQVSDGMYMITATDPEEIGQLTKEDVAAYCDQLKSIFDFTNIQKDGEYENRYGEAKYGLSAATDDGIVVELDYGSGSDGGDPSFLVLVVFE